MDKIDNSSTFADNMSLPIHRWYRYTAGFSSEWVKCVVQDKIKKENDNSIKVLDPFAGSGTTLLACDEMGISSIGYESQPLIYKIASSKLSWDADIQKVISKTKKVLKYAKGHKFKNSEFPEIVKKCYDEKNLAEINALKQTIDKLCKDSKEDKLVWMGFVSTLRSSSHVGTAIGQYVLPNKTKAKVLSAFEAFERQMEVICEDIDVFQKNGAEKKSLIIQQDAREKSSVEDNSIDLIITSPPYANNYDYADATRLELSVLGDIKSYSDLKTIRPALIRSCSQMISKERQRTYEYLEDPLYFLLFMMKLLKYVETWKKKKKIMAGKRITML